MQLSLVLAVGATFFSFDFTGSGLSDGDYVSLGKFEKEDLKCVTEYLGRLGSVSSIVLWGRSMGAVTALLYLSEHEKLDRDNVNGKGSLSAAGSKKEDPNGSAGGNALPSSSLISGVILDSPFSDLKVLAEDIIENGRKVGLYAPGFVVDYVMNTIQKKIQKTVGFDIKDIRPIASVGSLSTPALFVAAASDRFISPTHSQALSEHYGGDCKFIVIDGDHNAVRSSIMYNEAFRFLAVSLDIPRSQISHKSLCVYDAYPWSNLAQTR
jgi:pimeloyl-ACP methyl ester carboxylesterase